MKMNHYLLVQKLSNKKNLFFFAYGLTLATATSLFFTDKYSNSFHNSHIVHNSSSNKIIKHNNNSIKSLNFSSLSSSSSHSTYSSLSSNMHNESIIISNDNNILNSFQNYIIF
jgi:hypothetical protein